MTLGRLIILVLCATACSCSPDAAPTADPQPNPISNDAASRGELPVEFGDSKIVAQAIALESGKARWEFRCPGPQSKATFIPLWLSEEKADGNPGFEWIAESSQGELTGRGEFQRVASGEWNGDKLFALAREPYSLTLPWEAGTSVTMSWGMSSSAPGAFAIVMPKIVAESGDRDRPDILMVCADALRHDHSISGRGSVFMPNLQELMRDSAVFDHAYSAGSWTLPSMSSFLTGMWPLMHGAGSRPDAPAESNVLAGKFPTEIETFPEILRRNGYGTLLFYANAVVGVSEMYREGFDYPVECIYQPASLIHDRLRAALALVPEDVPVLVIIHYLDIHHYKQWGFARSQARGVLPTADPSSAIAAYEQAVTGFDHSLEELRTVWNATRDFDSTLFVLFADHGEHLVDPGYAPLLQEANANPMRLLTMPLFSHGSSMDEVLLRVPLLVRRRTGGTWPTGVSSAPVSLVDLFPTVLAEAGITDAPVRDGLRLQMHESQPAHDSDETSPRLLFADYQIHGDQLSSIREGRLKLVINHTLGGQTLLDTSLPMDERGESAWVVPDESEAARLRDAWEDYRERAELLRDQVPQPVIEQTDKVLQEMRQMGYL